MIEPALERVRVRLRESADAEFALGQRRFFQHEVDTWGVRGPELKAISRELYRDVKPWTPDQRNRLFVGLMKSGKLEEGALVCYVARRFAKDHGPGLFRVLDGWLDKYVNNWAMCDGLSTWLLAGCIANAPELIAELPPWTTSANRWRRRSAAVSMLQEGKRGRNTAAIFDIAGRLMADPDDMVQKGVGWLLKETYPKKPREVVRFLEPWRGKSPRLLLRYAAEKMTPDDRAYVLLKPDLEQQRR